MKSKLIMGLAVAVAVGCAGAVFLLLMRPAARVATTPKLVAQDASAPAKGDEEKPTEQVVLEIPASAEAPPPQQIASAPDSMRDAPAPVSSEPAISEPEARAALRLVGIDPAAEAIWILAINDPALSAHARSNLIEDLNEDGFPDPKAVTQADLPLIVKRLELIDQLAPSAMDGINAAAFQEARKDLSNMYRRLTGL